MYKLHIESHLEGPFPCFMLDSETGRSVMPLVGDVFETSCIFKESGPAAGSKDS